MSSATAEVLREPPAQPEKSPAPSAPAPTFADVIARLEQAGRDAKATREAGQSKVDAARREQQSSAEAFAVRQADELAQTKTMGEQFAGAAQQGAAALDRTAPTLTPPPPRTLRGFLMPSATETPETSIQRAITGITLLATMIGGGRSGAQASLAALTGSLQGWQAGDRDRADRHFADWQAKTKTMLDAWTLEKDRYDRWFKVAGLPLEQRMRGMQLDAQAFKNVALAQQLRVESMDAALAHIDKTHEAATRLAADVAKLTASHEQAQALEQLRREIAAETARYHSGLLSLRAQDATRQPSADAVDTAARLFIEKGTMPRFGMRANASWDAFWSRVGELGREMGGPAGIAARQNLMAGLRKALIDVESQQAKIGGFVDAFSKALDLAVRLSDKRDHSGVPAVERWIRAGRKKIAGDPDVALLDAQVLTIGREYARATSGSVVAPEGLRKEVDDKISASLTPEQFRQVASGLKYDVDAIVGGLRNQTARIQAQMTDPTHGDPSGPATTAPTMKIRRKAGDTTTLFEGPKGPVPEGFELVP